MILILNLILFACRVIIINNTLCICLLKWRCLRELKTTSKSSLLFFFFWFAILFIFIVTLFLLFFLVRWNIPLFRFFTSLFLIFCLLFCGRFFLSRIWIALLWIGILLFSLESLLCILQLKEFLHLDSISLIRFRV